MNKKGFTLIELIITITLIALVGTIFTGNFIKVLNDQKNKQAEEFKETLEDAACTYAILTPDECSVNCSVLGSDLIEAGLVDEVINNIEVSTKTIDVHYNTSGQRICEMR